MAQIADASGLHYFQYSGQRVASDNGAPVQPKLVEPIDVADGGHRCPQLEIGNVPCRPAMSGICQQCRAIAGSTRARYPLIPTVGEFTSAESR